MAAGRKGHPMTRHIRRALMGCVAASLLAAVSAQAAITPTSAGIARAADGQLPKLLACLRTQKIALVGAHRGGPIPEHPENALATMIRTTSLVPVFIETDVQQTSDGVLFQNHDDVLERNMVGKGVIRQMTWAQISALKLRDQTGQPTAYAAPLLADLLTWADGKALLFLDVKPQTDADLLVKAVTAAKADGRVMYLAYTIDQALALRQRRPQAVLALPMYDRAQFEKAKAAGLVGPNTVAMLRPAKADAALISELETLGVTIMSGSYGGADTPDAVYRTTADSSAYLNLVKAGPRLIVSNRPVEAASALLTDPDYRRKLALCGVEARAGD